MPRVTTAQAWLWLAALVLMVVHTIGLRFGLWGPTFGTYWMAFAALAATPAAGYFGGDC